MNPFYILYLAIHYLCTTFGKLANPPAHNGQEYFERHKSTYKSDNSNVDQLIQSISIISFMKQSKPGSLNYKKSII